MYKATVSYPYGGGKRIRTIHYASTKFFAWLKAKWSTCFKNNDFFDIKVDVE